MNVSIKKVKATTINNVNKHITNIYQSDLHDELLLDGKVLFVNRDKKVFYIGDELQEGIPTEFIECVTSLKDINDLQDGDIVRLYGKLKLDKKHIGRLVLNVELFFKVSEQEKMKDKIATYQKNKQCLFLDKRKLILEKFRLRKKPLYIRNFGVISIEGSEDELLKFKNQFTQKCKGKMIICSVKKHEVEQNTVLLVTVILHNCEF